MSIFRKKEKKHMPAFDLKEYQPVIRASICTGEKVAGFRSRESGKFEEVVMIATAHDLDEFCRIYGITEKDIKKEW